MALKLASNVVAHHIFFSRSSLFVSLVICDAPVWMACEFLTTCQSFSLASNPSVWLLLSSSNFRHLLFGFCVWLQTWKPFRQILFSFTARCYVTCLLQYKNLFCLILQRILRVKRVRHTRHHPRHHTHRKATHSNSSIDNLLRSSSHHLCDYIIKHHSLSLSFDWNFPFESVFEKATKFLCTIFYDRAPRHWISGGKLVRIPPQLASKGTSSFSQLFSFIFTCFACKLVGSRFNYLKFWLRLLRMRSKWKLATISILVLSKNQNNKKYAFSS